MTDNPYARFTREEMILRDLLAIDRTILANERTLLSYVRTALAQLVTGVSLIKFFGSLILTMFGWLFIPAGLATLVIGFVRYRRMSRSISATRAVGGPEAQGPDGQ